jgi:hypothetical protein
MRGSDRRGDVFENRDSATRLDPALGFEEMPKRAPLEQLHDQIRLLLAYPAKVVDGDDIR